MNPSKIFVVTLLKINMHMVPKQTNKQNMKKSTKKNTSRLHKHPITKEGFTANQAEPASLAKSGRKARDGRRIRHGGPKSAVVGAAELGQE
jgi:hypothetical protein